MARHAWLVHFDGRIMAPESALISALSPALSHGPIAYDTLLGTWNEEREQLFIFRLHDHLRRLNASMRALRFEEQLPVADLEQRVLALARANAFRENIHFRVQVFPQERDDNRQVATRCSTLIVVTPRASRLRVAMCQTSAWRRPGDDSQPARIKAVGIRMFARVAMAQAKEDGYDQVLLLNDRGKVAEGVSSNIFVVRGGVVATPSITASILEGITRSTLIALLQEEALACEQRDVDRSELYDCDEAFLCSTLLGLLPISSVDRIPIGDGLEGPVTRRLREKYEQVLRGNGCGHEAWLTPVYDDRPGR